MPNAATGSRYSSSPSSRRAQTSELWRRIPAITAAFLFSSILPQTREALAAATIIPEFRLGSCGPGGPDCVWPCNLAFPQSVDDLLCSCDDGGGPQSCVQGASCSTGTCPTCALDTTVEFVGRLAIEIDDDEGCDVDNGVVGSKVTVALRGGNSDGSGQFDAVTRVFDFCGVDTSCNEYCDTGVCSPSDPSCAPASTFLCELADTYEQCGSAPPGQRRLCERDLTVDTTVVRDWLWRGKQPLLRLLGTELVEPGAPFDGQSGDAVVVDVADDPAFVIDNASDANPSRVDYCVTVRFLSNGKSIGLPLPVLNALSGGSSCTDPECLHVTNLGSCNAATACPAAPLGGCVTGTDASVKIRRGSDATKAQLKWKLQHGDAVAQGDLGSPTTSTAYALCIYDRTSGAASLAGALDVAGGAGWVDKDPHGFNFDDKVGSQSGVRKIQLRPGSAGSSKAQVKAKGATFAWPAAVGGGTFFDQDTSVTVQLINSSTATCWSSDFSTASKNDSERYNAKLP